MSTKKIIGIWGYPDPKVLNEVKLKYPAHEIIDLDQNFNHPNTELLPDNTCKIIKNIVDNSIQLKNDIEFIVASVGEEKCDAGRFAAKILKELGFNIIETKYNKTGSGTVKTPIATSGLPLKQKVLSIMDNIIIPVRQDFSFKQADYGFWGVPPNDVSILDLFPDNTHVYGWTRCVEAGVPADLDLEMFIDENIPTVFYAQTFCAKMQLGKYLARKYNGLYLDVDDVASNSVKAKIEAFIRLG